MNLVEENAPSILVTLRSAKLVVNQDNLNENKLCPVSAKKVKTRGIDHSF